jgi:hypothetical protein
VSTVMGCRHFCGFRNSPEEDYESLPLLCVIAWLVCRARVLTHLTEEV